LPLLIDSELSAHLLTEQSIVTLVSHTYVVLLANSPSFSV